ncbi:MAG: RNA methyltransferase [Desulfosudis oleivorans]|nr:RNA methyltransferase [Desulfosudis oleivorans]
MLNSIEEALGGFNYIVGTTARMGKARGPFVSPRAAAQNIADLSQKNKVALLFGPEDTGLANDHLRLCHSVVTIPTSREFTSLNLSQAVMILCYEIFIASSSAATAAEATPKLALSSELEGMYGQIKDIAGQNRFFKSGKPRILDAGFAPLFLPRRTFIERSEDYSRYLPQDGMVCTPQKYLTLGLIWRERKTLKFKE